MAPFDVATVRRYAREYGWKEVQHNVASAVLGFARGDQRCNVYYTTGTVGTCLDHPRSGKTQLFRRNVTLQELRAILADPRHHTWKGYYRRHSAQRPEPSPGGALRAGGPHLECSIDSALDYPTLTYSTTVQQRLEAVWPGQDAVLALNEDGYTLVDADLADGDGLPPSLAQLLRRRRRRRRAPVDYVALDSSSDSWFVQFTSSKWEADVCDSLRRALESKAGVDVEVLAFAPHGGWYVLWEDGHYDWQGLPRKLHDQLNGRQRSLPGVERLAIGPGGGYWARFLDGSTRWHGLPHQCSAAIARRMDEGWTVEQVALGGSVDCPSWAFAYS